MRGGVRGQRGEKGKGGEKEWNGKGCDAMGL